MFERFSKSNSQVVLEQGIINKDRHRKEYGADEATASLLVKYKENDVDTN